MNKKVSDILDNIDHYELDNIEFHEDIKKNISLDRIKARAMSAAIQNGKAAKKGRKLLTRLLLPAAIITLMSATVFGTTYSEAFRDFFGDSIFFITGNTQEVQRRDNDNGVTFTVESSVTDDSSSLIIFSFKKDDGTAFDKSTTFGNIFLNIGTTHAYKRTLKFTEDYKTLLGYINVMGDEKFYGKKVSLTVENLVAETSGEQKVDINLYNLYKNSPLEKIKIDEDLERRLAEENPSRMTDYSFYIDQMDGMSLMEEVSELKLYGVGFIDGKLILLTEIDNPLKNSGNYGHIEKLYNEKTGETIARSKLYGGGIETTESQILQSVFEVPDIESLEYLKPIVSYNLRDTLIKGKWTVDFKLEKNMDRLKLKPMLTYEEIADGKRNAITIKEISVSVIGIKIKGESTDRTPSYQKAPEMKDSYIVMKDGQKYEFIGSYGSMDEDGFTLDFSIDGLIDVKNVEYIILSGHRINAGN